jgi:site-specific DNA-methyltransferase (adenine-specific)
LKNNPLPRLDKAVAVREKLLPLCRFKPGDIWIDAVSGHRLGCLDAADGQAVARLMAGEKAQLAAHDPPYNLAVFEQRKLEEYLQWCQQWVGNSLRSLAENAAFYVWLGADQNEGFQPLPDFMLMMRGFPQLTSRSFITLRNQRGYGTQKNWMAVRQELLYYTQGKPVFNMEAEYTDIPKILRGYYKEVKGRRTDNLERGKSDCIRAGNVWVDIQQVFYRMQENVSGCYAQKPLQAMERIIRASSNAGDAVQDLFAHSGSTLLACERLGRRCFTMDKDPVYCEISLRRLELYRQTGGKGWQNGHPFEQELGAAAHVSS